MPSIIALHCSNGRFHLHCCDNDLITQKVMIVAAFRINCSIVHIDCFIDYGIQDIVSMKVKKSKQNYYKNDHLSTWRKTTPPPRYFWFGSYGTHSDDEKKVIVRMVYGEMVMVTKVQVMVHTFTYTAISTQAFQISLSSVSPTISNTTTTNNDTNTIVPSTIRVSTSLCPHCPYHHHRCIILYRMYL